MKKVAVIGSLFAIILVFFGIRRYANYAVKKGSSFMNQFENNNNPKLQEQISHTINPIKSVFSLIFIFYGLNLTGGSSGEKLFGCLIASLPAR